MSFGWPFYSSAWPLVSAGYASGYDSGYYAPDYAYEPRMAYDSGRYEEAERSGVYDRSYGAAPSRESNRDTGRLRLEVRPDDASVYVDDQFWGSARDTKFLTLRSGLHAIDLVRPGFVTAHREVEIVGSETRDVLVEMPRVTRP